MNQYQLVFDIQSDWHIGSGIDSGAYADALVLKDQDKLPYLPGKSIKGLLRQAFLTAVDNYWFDDAKDLIKVLFGDENREGIQSQGVLQISNATIMANEKSFLIDTPKAVDHLYRVLQFTAINPETGVAKNTSLRSMEVVVPMLLTADLELNVNHPSIREQKGIVDTFVNSLEQVLPLITGLGAKRHRGFGQVVVSLRTNSAKGDQY